ncbi:hypothetical protein NC652_018826 [Populus alba x Populus x berolinensis]|uniref:EF-hand domain-containing protein n=4 Tax=Populus TaxID=3689 RepID=A0A8X8CVR4_POPTO|nr:calmodulin-like protein 30 [Populus alba]KAG6766966.1 hypothetical protein POTOM_028145 [Populus tomentosa]KAJ6916249.1 hypothetical protein NC652_018826 [Populus alba x Populus x berolinensis]KAG6768082.1 hypothetical protein POTOM_026979 [Populus tomentosa]KAJ6990226.1 hypothetical protein NC653_018690 [Populus alba x Populus x berolinensis]TKS13624.1 hypothetical protein D5086_0000051180 [Populus alba]
MSHLSFLNFHGLPRNSSSSSLTPTESRIYREKRQSCSVSKSMEQNVILGQSSNESKSFQPNVEEMKWVFDKFDLNKDGKISRQEYKSALRALGKGLEESEMVKAFQATDIDGDGYIDFKEFMEMMHNMGDGVKSSDIESAFRVFDLDGNGKISAEELMEVLKRLGERSSLDACRKMIRAVDGDGDGLIDMNEFMGMMTRTMKMC